MCVSQLKYFTTKSKNFCDRPVKLFQMIHGVNGKQNGKVENNYFDFNEKSYNYNIRFKEYVNI